MASVQKPNGDEKDYLCYGCLQPFSYSELASECMCENEKPYTGRGVCRFCYDNNVKLNIPDPKNHCLQKIHTYLPDCHKFWQDLDKTYGTPGYTFTDDGFMKILYWEGPNGEHTYKAMRQNSASEEDMWKAVTNTKTKVIKEMTLDKMRKLGQCLCCKH